MGLDELRRNVDRLKDVLRGFLAEARYFVASDADIAFRFVDDARCDARRFLMLFVAHFAPCSCTARALGVGDQLSIDFRESGDETSSIIFRFAIDPKAKTVSLENCEVSLCSNSRGCTGRYCNILLYKIVDRENDIVAETTAAKTLWRAATWCFSEAKVKKPLLIGSLELRFDDGSKLVLNPDVFSHKYFFPFIIVPPKKTRKQSKWWQLVFCKASVAQLILQATPLSYEKTLDLVKKVKKASKELNAYEDSCRD